MLHVTGKRCVSFIGVEKVAILKRCDDENSRTYQRWGVKGDPRKMVCDEFVPGKHAKNNTSEIRNRFYSISCLL